MPKLARSGAGRIALRGGVVVLVAMAVLIGTSTLGPGATELGLTSPGARPSQGPPLESMSVAPAPTIPTPTVRAVVIGWHVPILMYHHIGLPGDAAQLGLDFHKPGLNVPPTVFAAQMDALHGAGWTTITAAALAADLLAGTPPPPKTFVITVDDGHEDAYLNALPVLRADGFVATFFVITSDIGRGVALRMWELEALQASGMDIEDHTVHHVPLARQSTSTVLSEILGAATWLGAVFGTTPTTLAYPFGSVDAAVAAIVQSVGFSMAFTTQHACTESTATRFLTPRLHINPTMTPAALVAEVTACEDTGVP